MVYICVGITARERAHDSIRQRDQEHYTLVMSSIELRNVNRNHTEEIHQRARHYYCLE